MPTALLMVGYLKKEAICCRPAILRGENNEESEFGSISIYGMADRRAAVHAANGQRQ
jgi:hypothetical protein